MSEFKLEERYVVVKLNKLTQRQLFQLQKILRLEKIPTTECLVLEPDWPEYPVALEAIKERVESQ